LNLICDRPLLQEKESFGNDVDAEFALNNRRNGYNSKTIKAKDSDLNPNPSLAKIP
jgi:hypothetical protein